MLISIVWWQKINWMKQWSVNDVATQPMRQGPKLRNARDMDVAYYVAVTTW